MVTPETVNKQHLEKYGTYTEGQLQTIAKNAAVSEDKKAAVEAVMIMKGYIKPENAVLTEGFEKDAAAAEKTAKTKAAAKPKEAKGVKKEKVERVPREKKEKVVKEKKVRVLGKDLSKPFYYAKGEIVKFVPSGNSKFEKGVELEGEITSSFVFNETAHKCYIIKVKTGEDTYKTLIKRQVSLLELNPRNFEKLDAAYAKEHNNVFPTFEEFLASVIKEEKVKPEPKPKPSKKPKVNRGEEELEEEAGESVVGSTEEE
jgi:hypothetical protein